VAFFLPWQTVGHGPLQPGLRNAHSLLLPSYWSQQATEVSLESRGGDKAPLQRRLHMLKGGSAVLKLSSSASPLMGSLRTGKSERSAGPFVCWSGSLSFEVCESWKPFKQKFQLRESHLSVPRLGVQLPRNAGSSLLVPTLLWEEPPAGRRSGLRAFWPRTRRLRRGLPASIRSHCVVGSTACGLNPSRVHAGPGCLKGF
jgi:hypothetical protein